MSNSRRRNTPAPSKILTKLLDKKFIPTTFQSNFIITFQITGQHTRQVVLIFGTTPGLFSRLICQWVSQRKQPFLFIHVLPFEGIPWLTQGESGLNFSLHVFSREDRRNDMSGRFFGQTLIRCTTYNTIMLINQAFCAIFENYAINVSFIWKLLGLTTPENMLKCKVGCKKKFKMNGRKRDK